MEIKHTPGEWLITGYAGEHDEGGAAIKTKEGKWICSTSAVQGKTDKDWEEYYANAKLIKAAPKMLKALLKTQETIRTLLQEGLLGETGYKMLYGKNEINSSIEEAMHGNGTKNSTSP